MTLGPSLLESLGYTAIGAIVGVAALSLGAVAYLRRFEIRSKYLDVRENVRERIEERRSKKE